MLKEKHFPKAKTFTLPAFVVLSAAKIFWSNFNIRAWNSPDRVLKLMCSTDVIPSWLEAEGHATRGKLPSAFTRWQLETSGKFD